MKIGLVLGKYAPFHKGHQLVVEKAIREMDKVVCLIYETDLINIPLQIRAQWIRTLYPSIEVIECWDGPEGYGLDEETVRIQNNYIHKMLDGRKITHFYSSEFYGESVSQSLNAENIVVDTTRVEVPVSGTMIRSNPYRYRHFLSPVVYNDMIVRVVFVGAMSTGKSTITEHLARVYDTVFMPEYGREYWATYQQGRRLAIEDFDNIATEHLKRENELAKDANRFIFVDTNAITTYNFCKDYHSTCPPLLQSLAKSAEKTYDLYFLCEDDIPYDDTWDRSGEQKREWFHKMTIADLRERKIPFIRLTGNLSQRIKRVQNILDRYQKYTNPLDLFEY